MSIGKRIKERRKILKLTQEELGKLINVSTQVISNWEREYSFPDHEDLQRLAWSLEVSVDYLVTGEHVKEKDDVELSNWVTFGKNLKEKGYLLKQIEDLIKEMMNTFK